MSSRFVHWAAALLLVGQLAGLVLAIPAERSRGSHFSRIALYVVGPIASLVSTLTWAGEDLVSTLATKQRLSDENARLRQELNATKLRVLELSGKAEAADRLAAAAAYQAPEHAALRAADVVYIDHLSWLRSMVVHTGSPEVRVNTPVVGPNGLVGRVVDAVGGYAKVQLLTDRAAAVGVMIGRTRRQGVARGLGDAELELSYLPVQADVRIGDQVLTSGVDGIYPRGVAVGWVRAVGTGGGLFHAIEVSPAEDFGTLDVVYLLATPALPAGLLDEPAP